MTVAALCMPAAIADDVVMNGVKYITVSHTDATCKADNSKDKNLTEITVSPMVIIDGTTYTVSSVQENGFRGCKFVKKINLPNSIKKIGANSFRDCKSLVSVVLPDEAEVELSQAVYDSGDNGPFYGCSVLSDVRGNTNATPLYVLNKAFRKCKNVPFTKQIPMLSAAIAAKSSMAAVDTEVPSFTEYCRENVRKPMNQWKRRKSYETEEQWKERVSEEAGHEKLLELVESARDEYVRLYSPLAFAGMPGDYDKDYNMLAVETPTAGTFYIKVPADQAQTVRESFSSMKFEPVYGVINDQLGVVRCKASLGNVVYNTPDDAGDQDIETLALQVMADRTAAPVLADGATPAPGQPAAPKKKTITSKVDKNIPSSGVDNKRTFAVIIGNENYQRGIAEVPFALHDAEIFAKYCNKTLGLPDKNIRSYQNATFGDLLAAVRDISNIATAYDGDVDIIFYYAGHGIPDEKTREAYLLPVDADGTALEVCYPLKRLYDELGNLEARSVTVFLDACFSGATRGEEMLAQARGVMVRPQRAKPVGNMVIFSATNGDQAAFPYKENGHGLFTYYLLEKLQETSGDISLGELSDYVSEQVSKQSLVVNRKSQTPTVNVSAGMLDQWQEKRFMAPAATAE